MSYQDGHPATTESDDQLMLRLSRAAAEVDPVPFDVLEAAKAALGTADLDAELAVLVGDSAADDAGSPAGARGFETVRSGPGELLGSRLLSFSGGGVQVDLEVSPAGAQLDLMGQVSGAEVGECFLEYPRGRAQALELDSLGRFLVSGAPRGPVRLRCRSAGGAQVRTAWVTL